MSSKQRANLTLLALAISAFAIGSTEFISVGLMPLMIKDFGITMSQAGLTVSMYALGITIGAPILAILTSRWPRKNLLLGIMVVFIIGNLTVAFAPAFACNADFRIKNGLVTKGRCDHLNYLWSDGGFWKYVGWQMVKSPTVDGAIENVCWLVSDLVAIHVNVKCPLVRFN